MKWKKTGKRKEGVKSKQSPSKEEEGKSTGKTMCYLSLCLPPSPTHSSKNNDHRKVISKLSQLEDSESTENHKKHIV